MLRMVHFLIIVEIKHRSKIRDWKIMNHPSMFFCFHGHGQEHGRFATAEQADTTWDGPVLWAPKMSLEIEGQESPDRETRRTAVFCGCPVFLDSISTIQYWPGNVMSR